MTTATIAKGMTFTHRHLLDLRSKPSPGEKHRDGPKAQCVVTSVRAGEVFFRYDWDESSRGAFVMDRAAFVRDYLGGGES